jgi:hypothetical protein
MYQAAIEEEHRYCSSNTDLGAIACLVAAGKTRDAAKKLDECLKTAGQVGIPDQVQAHETDVAYLQSFHPDAATT